MRKPSFFILSVLLYLSSITSAADISPGSTISVTNPNQYWTSPSSTFSLRFIAADDDPDTHFAAVTYDGNTPIWVAGGSLPGGGACDSTASLQLLPDGNVRLVNGSNSAVVWQSNTAGRGVTVAAVDDSGNFVLRNRNVLIWSSFENPTDTILPNQNFTVNNVLRSGFYSFRLLETGNLTLRWNDSIVYWNLGLNSSVNTNLSSPSLGFQPTGILSVYDPMLSSAVVMVYSSDYGEVTNILRFVKLGTDGNLRIYSSTNDSGTNNVRWAAVQDQCEVFGFCGNMGICSYHNSKPVCGCPSKNFDPVDPRDGRKGCKRKMELEDCSGSATMLQLDNAKFLTYPPELSSQIFWLGIGACRSNCLPNGLCVASTSLADGMGRCYLKLTTFISGYQSPTVPGTSFVKVCGPVEPNPLVSSGRNGGWRFRGWLVVVVVVGTLLGLLVLEGGLWWLCCRNSPKLGTLSAQYALLEKKFSSWAYEEFEKGNIEAVLDKRLQNQEVDMDQVKRAIQVSFWCIQEQPSQRPMMGKVVQMLEGITDIEMPPAPKAAAEGPVCGLSTDESSSVSAISNFATSATDPSSMSSLQTAGNWSYNSGKNAERASSSLIQSDTN
ncbi:hypothetical protein LguiB_018113 [Lonicera macranthoides]